MVERERVRVKGGPMGLPKFFGGVIVGDGLGNSSFGGSDAFSVPSAVGWWAREFCAVGGVSSLRIALSSPSVELGGSAFGVTDFRYFFKSALWGGGSDRDKTQGKANAAVFKSIENTTKKFNRRTAMVDIRRAA